MLIRLNEQGLLEAKWSEPEREGRPARHIYRLTAQGMALAKSFERSNMGAAPVDAKRPVDAVRAVKT